MINYYLAIDIGASSGRHILGHIENNSIILEEIYRFDNLQIERNGHYCWDTDNLWNGILNGLKACKSANKIPISVAIDTWGVDFVLLDKNDNIIGDAVSYRDNRTIGMDKLVDEKINPLYLYNKTGTQKATYNTVYQLMALKQEHPEQLENAEYLLMSPDYWNFRLTGVKTNEYTIATTTNLVNAKNKNWDKEIIEKLGLPTHIFHNLSMPKTVVGKLRSELVETLGFDTTVILPATHDTGSAFLAIPAVDDNAVYISSGTWSLLGVENSYPITTKESFEQNFANEGGAFNRYRYLKNIMGLWIIQSIRRELNGITYIQGKEKRSLKEKQWTFPDLIAVAKENEDFESVINVNKDCFLAPESMIDAIKTECADTSQKVPQTVGEIMQCVYRSLAEYYKESIKSLELLTEKQFTSINIVGGGCQDSYLNEMTAKITGLPVYSGPIEGTAIGNLIVQMIVFGELKDLSDARSCIRKSFNIEEVFSK